MKYGWALAAGVLASASRRRTRRSRPPTPPSPSTTRCTRTNWSPTPSSPSKPGPIAFGAGEKHGSALQYGLVTAGEATMEIRNIADIGGRPVLPHRDRRAHQRLLLEFFTVRDRYESYMDTKELHSLRYEKHIREGKFKRDESVDFRPGRSPRHLQRTRWCRSRPRTQDVLSALYYVRALPLEVGQSISLAKPHRQEELPAHHQGACARAGEGGCR